MQQYADIYLLQSHFTCFGCHITIYCGRVAVHQGAAEQVKMVLT